MFLEKKKEEAIAIKVPKGFQTNGGHGIPLSLSQSSFVLL